MTENIYNNSKSQLQALSSTVGEGGKFLIDAYIRRAYIEGVISLVVFAIQFYFCLSFYKNAKEYAKELKQVTNEDEQSEKKVGVIVSSIMLIILLIFSCYSFATTLERFFAPEHRAVQLLIEDVKSLK